MVVGEGSGARTAPGGGRLGTSRVPPGSEHCKNILNVNSELCNVKKTNFYYPPYCMFIAQIYFDLILVVSSVYYYVHMVTCYYFNFDTENKLLWRNKSLTAPGRRSGICSYLEVGSVSSSVGSVSSSVGSVSSSVGSVSSSVEHLFYMSS